MKGVQKKKQVELAVGDFVEWRCPGVRAVYKGRIVAECQKPYDFEVQIGGSTFGAKKEELTKTEKYCGKVRATA